VPNMNYFFLSSLPVLLLKIIPIVCVIFVLQSTESLCSLLTPADNRFMTALKRYIPIVLSDMAPCSKKHSTSFFSQYLSKVLLKVRVIFGQGGLDTDLVPGVLTLHVRKNLQLK